MVEKKNTTRRTTTKKKTVATERKKCTSCGEDKRVTDYYYSASYVNRMTKSTSICKLCVNDYVRPQFRNMYDMKMVMDILRMIDKPFIQGLWESSEKEATKSDREFFGTYMKNIAMNQFRELTWENSEFEIVEKIKESKYEDAPFTQDDLKVFRKFWGDFPPEGYVFLEEFYGEYTSKFPTDTPAQINIYKNLAKIHWNAEIELASGNIKNYKDLMDLSSKLHNDGDIKPIQFDGSGESKGASNYGLWIRDIENNEPCEFFEKRPVYEDYDGFGKYFEKWVLRPMKNIFGKEKDFNVGDDK